MLLLSTTDRRAVTRLLAGYGLDLRLVAAAEPIPGSYWGESEAGLHGSMLFARLDTPLHSILHEAAHYICMTPERRAGLYRDAGGDDAEESAVCYLQILLADGWPSRARADLSRIWIGGATVFVWGPPGPGSSRMPRDARSWLIERGLIDEGSRPTGVLRD